MGELFRSALRPLRVLSGADPGVCRAVCETRALSGPQSGEGYPSDLLRALCTVLCREPVFMAPACDWFSVPRTSSPSAGLARGRGGPSSALGGAVDRRRRFLPAKPDSGCGASKRCQAGGGNTMAEEIRLALDDPSSRPEGRGQAEGTLVEVAASPGPPADARGGKNTGFEGGGTSAREGGQAPNAPIEKTKCLK